MMFAGEKSTGSTKTSLNFIDYEQGASVGTDSTSSIEEIPASGAYAALTLNNFQHHCGCCVIDGRIEFLDVIERNERCTGN